MDSIGINLQLWFGDERGYNATLYSSSLSERSCGLVMKEDITQRRVVACPHSVVVVW